MGNKRAAICVGIICVDDLLEIIANEVEVEWSRFAAAPSIDSFDYEKVDNCICSRLHIHWFCFGCGAAHTIIVRVDFEFVTYSHFPFEFVWEM